MIESRIRVICDRCRAHVDAPDGARWPTIVSALAGAVALGWHITEGLCRDSEVCPECAKKDQDTSGLIPFAMPLDLTNDLRTFVDSAVEALRAGRVVAIGGITVTRSGKCTAASEDGAPLAHWSTDDNGDRRVLAEAIFAALRVTP